MVFDYNMGDTNTGADSQISFTFDEFSSTENNFVNTETSKITKVTGNAIVNIDHSTPPLLNELSPHDKYLELELILKNLSTGEILSHFLNNQRKLLQNIGLYKQ